MLTFWLVGALFACNSISRSDSKWLSPEYKDFFSVPLPIPPQIEPLTSYTDPSSNTPIDFFQLNVTKFQAQKYPTLSATNLAGYNGMSPGPTFRIKRGRQSVIRVVNQNDQPSVMHLHGSYNRAIWDGWAEDLIQPGQYKDYYFPNSQDARTMFYHDHAVGITAQNVYRGQSGFYIVEEPDVEARLGLPQGDFDIPLGLTCKQYDNDAQLTSIANEKDDVFGDVVEVNGQPWPFLNVEPRKYRFRLLDMSVSRSFQLSILDSNSNPIDFQIVASDGGFTSMPVTLNSLTISMAERYEIVVDFATHAGQTLTMMNGREVFVADDFPGTDRIMQLRVGETVSSQENNGQIATSLVPLPSMGFKTSVDRTFRFDKKGGEWKINNVGFADVKNRILARPSNGDTEVWSLENHSGGWDHPVHIHMVDIQVLTRAKGRKSVQPWEKVAMKDMIVLGPNERVTVRVKFAPYNGLYMFHCHNLIHEDHAMMAAFNITELSDLGYSEADLAFTDPMEATWRAQQYTSTQIASVQSDVLPKFAATKAYANVTGLQRALATYWSTHSSQPTKNSANSAFGGMKFLPSNRYIPAALSLLMILWRY